MPEVLECLLITGRDADYQLKVVVRDMEHYQELLLERITRIDGVTGVHSSFVLRRVVERTSLPGALRRPPRTRLSSDPVSGPFVHSIRRSTTHFVGPETPPMHPTGRDQLPTAQQSDHLVFELLDPIHHLDDGARQRLLARARHFRLGPRERLDPAVVTGLMLYLVQGQVTRAIPGLGARADR